MGEVAGVTVSRLNEADVLICEMAHGFTANEKLIGSSSSLLSDRPGSEALKLLRPTILTREDVETKYQDFIKQDFMSGFESAIMMPVGFRSLYGFALQGEVGKIIGFEEYVECVRSLLSYYETTMIDKKGSNKLEKVQEESKALTPRQEKILELVRSGLTNQAISIRLAFSESLIRQETVIIYRKLGVTGRRDLIPQ